MAVVPNTAEVKTFVSGLKTFVEGIKNGFVFKGTKWRMQLNQESLLK